MKRLFLITILGALSISTMATKTQPSFSLLAQNGNLYVTIMGDSCNRYTANLNVAENCRDDRRTRNIVSTCTAELRVGMTKMACRDSKRVPKLLTLNLKDQNVAKEAKTLVLSRHGESVSVQLLKETPVKRSNTCYDEDGYHPVPCPK